MKAIGSAGFLIAGIAIAYAQADIAPTGTLRAAYLATNPAQAIRDAHTGEVRGVSFDLARELAKQIGKPLDFTLVELDNNPELIAKALVSREIDALGANRQRLTTLMKSVPGSRLLPDNFFNVPQNIVVPMDKPEILASINAFIDDLRTSGFLGDAVARSVVVGIEAAPKSLGSQHGCPG
jgi:ABC-type amino acid transport substrate-binding protein